MLNRMSGEGESKWKLANQGSHGRTAVGLRPACMIRWIMHLNDR